MNNNNAREYQINHKQAYTPKTRRWTLQSRATTLSPYKLILVVDVFVKADKLEVYAGIACLLSQLSQLSHSYSAVWLFLTSPVSAKSILQGMQSGLADFDVKGFDDALLKQGGSVHSPVEFLPLGTKLGQQR